MYYLYRLFTIIHKTIHVSRKYNVAAALWLKFMVHAVLFYIINILQRYIFTFRSTCTLLYDCFRVVPWCCAFDLCCSDVLWVISWYFHLPYFYWYHIIVVIIIIFIIIIIALAPCLFNINFILKSHLLLVLPTDSFLNVFRLKSPMCFIFSIIQSFPPSWS